MSTMNAVQELKSSWVQEELVGEEPYQVSLKSERVQEPALAAGGGEGKLSSFLELSLNQSQPVTIELFVPRIVITLHGTMIANNGAAPAQVRGEAG